jgi:hypothetical protein
MLTVASKATSFVLAGVLAGLCTACARPATERSVLDEAAAALGGAERLQALRSFAISGTGSAPNAGQNRMPDDDLPVWKVNEYLRTVDLANPRTRVRQVREAQFLFAGELVQQQTQGVDGDIAYNVAADGRMTRAGAAAVRDRRVEMLHHPITLVRAALDPAAKVMALRTEGNEQLIDVMTAGGEPVTLAVDASTHLPTRAISMADNANMGDVAIVTTFSDYQDVNGLKMPRRLTTKMDKYLQLDLQVSDYFLDADVNGLAVPAEIQSAPAPAPPPVLVTAEPVAKGIWWLAGSGNHRSIVFEFDDHLVLFEAPVNEGRTKAVIDKARTLSPKPLTMVVVSHHHFDHSGGLRAAVAEGLTIITHRANEAFFKDLLARKHTIVPDALAKNPRQAQFQFVDDQLTLKDGSMEVQLYHLLDNPREGTNLYAYVPRDRMLVQADLYDATWLRHSWGENVLDNLRRRGLTVERSVPVHGVVEPFEQMVKNIKAKPGTT